MNLKILKTLEDVIEKKQVQPEEAEFLRKIVAFECFDSTFRYKAKYREALDEYVKDKRKRG